MCLPSSLLSSLVIFTGSPSIVLLLHVSLVCCSGIPPCSSILPCSGVILRPPALRRPSARYFYHSKLFPFAPTSTSGVPSCSSLPPSVIPLPIIFVASMSFHLLRHHPPASRPAPASHPTLMSPCSLLPCSDIPPYGLPSRLASCLYFRMPLFVHDYYDPSVPIFGPACRFVHAP